MRVKLIKDYKLYTTGQILTVTPEKGAELIKDNYAKEVVRHKPDAAEDIPSQNKPK